jgi:AcrR family transcriptional regulator
MIDRTLRPVRRRKHARPRELLVAAMDLFIEKGFAATRTEEIAERAGASKGTLYLYFDSKEQLFTGLIAERFFCTFPFEGDEGLHAGTGAELLRGVMTAWRSALIEGRVGGVVKLAFTEVHHFPALADFWVHQVMAPTRAVVRQAVARGIASAEFGAVDPDLVMNALVQPLIATCLHRQVIDPYVRCPFITGDREPRGRHFEWVVRGLAGDRASRRDQESCAATASGGAATPGSFHSASQDGEAGADEHAD